MNHRTPSPTRLFDLATRRGRRTPDSTLIAYALLQLGLRRGDTIVLFARDTCFELGASQAGAVLLPLDDSLSAEELLLVATQVNIWGVVVADEAQYRHFRLLTPQLAAGQRAPLFFATTAAESIDTVGDLIARGRTHPAPAQVERIEGLISTDEVCHIEYRQGGVLRPLTHKQVLARM